MELSFIIIDDTELDHFIAQKMIGNANRSCSITSFLDATLALEHIRADNYDSDTKLILIFLDIYMPLMNGFEFIEEFEKFDQALQDKYYIIALTSTRDVSDLNRINSYRSFKNMINKPLTAVDLSTLLNKLTKDFNIKLP